MRVTVEEIARRGAEVDGAEVEVRGWLANRASKGKLHFLQLRDGTGVIQCVVVKGEVDDATFLRADHLPQETSLVVRGKVRRDPRSPLGWELGVRALSVVAEPLAEFPITPKEHGTAFLMEHRHLWLRSRRQVALLRVRALLIRAIRDFFDGRGFTLVDAPIFTPAACEGTTTLFEVDYFGEKAYLTQSGQLYMEAAAAALGRVYCFGPTFRAEKSKTRRHLTEFWMVEPEVAFMDLAGDMDLAEDFVCEIVARVRGEREAELRVLERDLGKLDNVKKPLPRISYDEAIAILGEAGKPVPWGEDFGGDEETVLSSRYDRPLLVHHYPAKVKAFYMKRDPERPDLALCVDVLAPEGYGEIIGGGQREEDLETLRARIREHELSEETLGWYLDLRRYGTVPHAGFGLGIERTLCWIAGVPHVRETIPFPRMLEKIVP
jgi:asparaginyl-tRNA synthetase